MHGLLHANEVDTTSMHAEYDDLQATIDNLSNTLFTLKDEVGGLPAVGSIAMIEISAPPWTARSRTRTSR